jgi:hypothetical protein
MTEILESLWIEQCHYTIVMKWWSRWWWCKYCTRPTFWAGFFIANSMRTLYFNSIPTSIWAYSSTKQAPFYCFSFQQNDLSSKQHSVPGMFFSFILYSTRHFTIVVFVHGIELIRDNRWLVCLSGYAILFAG